jgi:hypothetical protein
MISKQLKSSRTLAVQLQEMGGGSCERWYTTTTKLRIFRTNVKVVLLYGCETWKVTSDITNRIQVFINRCLRRIFRVFWPNVLSNEELWSRANEELVAIQIKRRKWRWIGHTLRTKQDAT